MSLVGQKNYARACWPLAASRLCDAHIQRRWTDDDQLQTARHLLPSQRSQYVRSLACTITVGPACVPDSGQDQSTFDWSKAPHAHPHAALKAAAMPDDAASHYKTCLAPVRDTTRVSGCDFNGGLPAYWMDAAMGLSALDVWQLPTDLTAFPDCQHICHTCHLAGSHLSLPAYSGSQSALINSERTGTKTWISPRGGSAGGLCPVI